MADQELSLVEELDLPARMAEQHPLHGMMARVLDDLGGQDFITDWADDNPGQFINMLMRLAPAAPPKGAVGGVHLHIHPDLSPTALDVGQGTGVIVDNAG